MKEREYLSEKHPEATVRHEIQWREALKNEGARPDGEIDRSTWSVELDRGLLSISGEEKTQKTTSALFSGGESGHFYPVENRVEVTDGRVLVREVIVPVGPLHEEPDTLTLHRAVYMARRRMRDEPELNELLMGELEFSWEELAEAVQAALMDWNSTQPITDYDLAGFPAQARSLLYTRSVVEALRSEVPRQARNQYDYSDQGFQASEHNKAGLYMQVAGSINTEYEKKKQRFKASKNAQSFWGGLHSDPAFGSEMGGW